MPEVPKPRQNTPDKRLGLTIATALGLATLSFCYLFSLNFSAFIPHSNPKLDSTPVPTQSLSTHIAPPPTETARPTAQPTPTAEPTFDPNIWCVDDGQNDQWGDREITPAGFICIKLFTWLSPANKNGSGQIIIRQIYPVHPRNYYPHGPVLYDPNDD